MQAALSYANFTSCVQITTVLSGLSSQFQMLSLNYAMKNDISMLSVLYASQTLTTALSSSVSNLQNVLRTQSSLYAFKADVVLAQMCKGCPETICR